MTFPPGPQIPALVGTFRLIKHPYELFEQCYRDYGDIFTLRLLRLRTAVFLADPEAIKEVFTSLAKKFNAGEINWFLEPFLGEKSLLLLDEPEHHRQRKLIMPAFHG